MIYFNWSLNCYCYDDDTTVPETILILRKHRKCVTCYIISEEKLN